MKIALQFSRSCARGRVPEVLTITLINIIGFAFIYASRYTAPLLLCRLLIANRIPTGTNSLGKVCF